MNFDIEINNKDFRECHIPIGYKSICYEIDKNYCEIIKQREKQTNLELF